ncbi:DUF6311 domain-containing protein [Escherichia coli]|uniref:DUF6311 domain-containing protein n=1 Tax=Escherichia coli TaxID=562 RepID=UPI000BB88E12|nr:DUF6311 domain-containing protein [Escherichia coli]
MFKTNKRIFASLFMLIFTTSIFFMYVGVNVLDFKRVGWLMIGDPGQSWSGWNFFRSTPLLQWPLGLNYNYGMGVGGSIVYTDSIPIMAFIFKPFSVLLPERFQYHGLWMYLCFLLMTFSAWLLLRKLTKNEIFSAVGSCFFCIAPIFLNRAGGHFALGAQWLILFGFYLYIHKSFCFKRWALLLVLSTTIHAYLLMMVYAVFSFDVLNKFLSNRLSLKKAFLFFVACSALIFVTMQATGYFVIKGSDPYPGFGFLNMDLAGWFNPGDQRYSHLILSHGSQQANFEGINYLGIGIITLLLFMLIDSTLRKDVDVKRIIKSPILYFCFVMTAVSVTYRINFYGFNLIEIPMNDFLLKVGGIFRSSGRFFWPVTMILMLIVLTYFSKSSKISTYVLIPILLISAADESSFFKAVRYIYMGKPYSSQMLSKEWEAISKGKDTIIATDYDEFSLKHWLPFAEFASSEKMKLNFGYFARADKEAIYKNKKYIDRIKKDGILRDNELYVATNKDWLKTPISIYGNKLKIKIIDGYYVAYL